MAKHKAADDHYEEFKLEHVKNETPFESHGRCFKCTFWQTLKDGFPSAEQNIRGIKGDHVGECRYSSPLWIDNRSQWPVCYEFDWCGKFQARSGKGGLALK